MKKASRLRILAILALGAALTVPAAPALAAPPTPRRPAAYTCTGGEIPSGTYARLTVTGACTVAPGAHIKVVGNVTVAAGAVLDAQSAPSTISVRRNVTAAQGSFLGLGCQPAALVGNSAHPCAIDPDGHSVIRVGGNVTALGATVVMLNGITVERNVTLIGGSGPIPWSIKNNTIERNLRVGGMTASWLGVLFNHVGGNATLINITVIDEHPDAPGVYVGHNTIGRNLVCFGLEPGVSGGFPPGSVNVVGHKAVGQCAALV